MEPSWNRHGTVMEPSWNRHVTAFTWIYRVIQPLPQAHESLIRDLTREGVLRQKVAHLGAKEEVRPAQQLHAVTCRYTPWHGQ